jgi:hypothetical protein
MVNYKDYYYKYKALKYYLKNNSIEKQKQIKGGEKGDNYTVALMSKFTERLHKNLDIVDIERDNNAVNHNNIQQKIKYNQKDELNTIKQFFNNFSKEITLYFNKDCFDKLLFNFYQNSNDTRNIPPILLHFNEKFYKISKKTKETSGIEEVDVDNISEYDMNTGYKFIIDVLDYSMRIHFKEKIQKEVNDEEIKVKEEITDIFSALAL